MVLILNTRKESTYDLERVLLFVILEVSELFYFTRHPVHILLHITAGDFVGHPLPRKLLGLCLPKLVLNLIEMKVPFLFSIGYLL